MTLRLLLALVLVGPIFGSFAAGASAQGIESKPIVLRLATPTYRVDETGVWVADYGRNDDPGKPALPVWSTLVELPPNFDWDVTYRSIGTSILTRTVDVQAVPVPNLSPVGPHGWAALPDLPASVPVADRPDPAVYGVDAFYPESPVVPGSVQWQRGRRLLPVRVFPFQYNPILRQLRYHPNVEITIQLTPVELTGDSAAGNQDRLPDLRSAPNPAANTAGSLRIRTSARGMHRLTYGDLLAAGVPLATVGPGSFAMSYLGEPIAVEVTGDGDDTFESGELVVFYAEPYQGRYQADNVYWFTYGGAPGLRMASRAVTPTGGEPLVTTITQTLHVEQNVEYRSEYPRPQDADHWFDTPLSPDILTSRVTVTQTYTLALDDPLTTGTLQVRAALHGGADRPANPDKSIAIRLNAHSLGTYQWEGLTYHSISTSAPAAWLDGAPNRVSLTAALSQLPGIDFYSVSPDWVELTYPALAEAENDRMVIESIAPGANKVAVAGFSTPSVKVYDVRQQRQPVKVTTTQSVGAAAPYTLHFWDADLPGPSYALSSEAALLAPLEIAPDTPSTWRTPAHEADYIAIIGVHRTYTGTTSIGEQLSQAVQPLLVHRADEGLRVVEVDVEDIYDEFSYGRIDPEAIRSFLSYAYHCWNGADCTPDPGGTPNPPAYVLLVGDGHYDFTGASDPDPPPNIPPNLIPPYLVDVDPWLGETASDSRYVSVDGPEDYLPDMAIGRIPANNLTEVAAVIDKTLAYETSSPQGAWQKRVFFVADNYADPAGNFHAFSDNVRLNWLPAPYDDRTIYYKRDYLTPSAMKTAIKAAFNDDSLLIQWFGHGSRFRWGSVTGIFNSDDPIALAVNDAWPFTASYTCWSGYFINLAGGWPSLGESFVVTPLRGSVADLSPSGLHLGDALLKLDQGLTQAVFRQRIERVGQAVDEAKLYYFGHSSSFHDVIDTSVLFGDPALKLRLPLIDLGSSSMDVSPAAAIPGDTQRYTVTLQNTATFTATDVTVAVDYDDAHGAVISSTPPAITANGVLTWTLAAVPPGTVGLTFDLQLAPVFPTGVTKLHAPTAVRSWGNALADLDAVSQVSAAPDLEPSALAVSRDWAPPGYPLIYTITLSNTGNAPSAVAWLTATLPTDLVSVTSTSLVYDPPNHRLTWQGAVPVGPPATLAFRGVISPARTACGLIEVDATLRDELSVVTPLSASVAMVVPDVDCDGGVDVVDIQQVTTAWGVSQGDPGFHPRYDLDGDGVIGVQDIVIAAAHWQ